MCRVLFGAFLSHGVGAALLCLFSLSERLGDTLDWLILFLLFYTTLS